MLTPVIIIGVEKKKEVEEEEEDDWLENNRVPQIIAEID
jgi:hypothetical protein